MRIFFVYPLFIVLSLFAFHCTLYNPAGADETALNVDEILKNLDPDKVNQFQAKEYFKDVKGKKAKGEGKVVYVLPVTKEQYKIRILTSASTPHKGYNVLLFTNQDASLDLNKGDLVIFDGQVERVTPYQGASLDMYGTYKKSGVK